MMDFLYKQNDRVRFSHQGIKGKGIVVKCVIREIPTPSKWYIISPDKYSHYKVRVPENSIKLIKQEIIKGNRVL